MKDKTESEGELRKGSPEARERADEQVVKDVVLLTLAM